MGRMPTPAASDLDPGLLDPSGDDDLRDARLLAFLLDPAAAHGAGHAALSGLGTLLAARGEKRLAQALTRVPPPPCWTTVRLRRGEVELVVTTPGVELVAVWRSAPGDYEGALELAAGDGALAVGIARTAALFPPETAATFPVLSFAELHQALARVAPAAGAAPLLAALRTRLSGVTA
jgi:hypothetical protein